MKKEYSLQIYKPNGENTDIELRKYQYNGSFMGERNITASISSPVKINWEIGDYVIFRNEPFTLRYVPPVKKQSRRGTYGEGYIYEGIVFSSIISQLMDVQFLDYVSNDNNIHYTGLSNFAFYVSNNSLTEFASRIKANIERVYGKDSWDIIVANKGVIIKDEDNNVIVEGSSFEFDDQSISITSGTSIYNAICLINTQLELNFLIRIVNGRKTIILGGSSVATAESLGYGKGRGLKSIQQSHNNNEQIVTRLHAYGSSRNLPYRYYNKKYNDKNKYPNMFDSNGNYLLESRYINKLMLPYKCWVQTSYLWDAFIQSKLADVIGIKEGEVTFDGSDEEWDEIYPSLEKQSVNDWEVGMTMYDSGYREYSETMRNRFLFNTRQMTSYGNTIEEIKKIFSLNTKNADDREQAKSILEDCKWTVTPGKEAYYEEAMKIIDEVWDGKDWDYKYDYAVQKTHKLSSTEKSNIKKYTYNGDGRLDRLPSGASIKDNGVSSDGSYTDGSTDTNGTIINTTFEVIIPQLGFDIEDWVSQDNSKATMSIKSGMCAGREFPINSCIAVDVNDYSKGWKLNLDRHQDMEVNMIFPNSVYRLDAGDEYVLTGIYMPDVYVESAENRLYNQAVKYLSDIDHTKYTYSLDVDSKWMKEHEDVANLLYEGCSIVFNDFDSGDEMSGVGDLNIGEISVVATQVTISFNEESLPKYTIVLSDDKHTAVNLQEMISASVKLNTISYANSISLLEKKINDKLSKTEQDEAQELITFLKGIKTAGIENDGNNITKGLTKLYDAIMSNGFKNSMTAGRGWQIDENGNAQVESIEVRSYIRALELVMNRLSAEESEFVFTESGTVETATLNEDGTYTLVMRKKTDKDITAFQVDDVLKGVVNNLAEQGTVGVNYYTSWMQVKEVNQTTNSIKVAVYPDNEVPSGTNFPPCKLMVLHRWGNADETKTKRQSCWYISSIEKRIVMLDGVTQPKLKESNYASFYGLPFDMGSFKGYDLNPDQPYLYVRGAFLQDVCFIDYLGKVVKQERYRGIWSQDVANSKDPYIVTQTTFDTVYHKNAKWQCNSTIGSKVEPSESTTDWTMLTDGGEAITVDSTDVYYCIFSSGEYAPNDNYDGWTQIVPTPTEEKPYLWTRTRWYFSDGTITPTYTVVRNGKNGANAPRVLYINSDTRPATPTSENPSGWGSIPLRPVAVSNMRAEKTSRADYSFGKVENAVHKEYWASLNKGIYNSIAEALIYFDADNDGTVRFDWYATCGSANKASIYKVNSQVDTVVWNIDGYKTGVYDATVNKGTNFIRVCYEKGEKNTDEDRLFIRVLDTSTSRRIWVVTEILTSDGEYAGWSDPVQWTGNDGRNLTKVTNYYKWGASGDNAPSEPYAPDTIPTHVEGSDYLWNYEVCSDDNEDTISQSGKTCIGYFPKDGAPGKDGKGIASITEYYQIGTERKPAAISISTDGTTVTIPSGWKTTMDTTTPDKRYVWNQEVIKYSNNTYSVTAVHLAGAQGDKGDPGEDGVDGNGMEYIYMRTEGCKAPNTPSTNGSTPTGWTKEPSGVNAEYPYEWVSMRIQEEGVWGSYSKPILWKEYYALNANLLEQTDFDGLLTKWENKSVYEGTSYEDDSINHISNDGKDGVNCYYDISSRMKYESLYKDVLIQRLVNGSVTRLKPSTWYTLSFYAKCGVNVKPVNLTSNEYGFGLRILYLEKGKRYKFSISGRIDSQAQKDGKTLWCYVYDRDWNWSKSLIIDTTSDAVKSIEFSDVPLSGTYEFRAYMYDNGGSRAGKVTLNWASVEEVDGELFSTYIYPSLVDNTQVFVDGEQKTVSSDCEVKYKASSSDWVRHTVTFKTRSTLGSKQNLLFRMLPIVMSDNTHYLKICMPKLEVGKVASAWQLNEADRMGKNGKPLVGPTEWDASADYMSGKADNEPYQSIVINPKYQKQMYLCGYSHKNVEPSSLTSTSSVDTCTEAKPWVQVPYQDFVATKVLFADKSLIKDLNAETIEMRDSNGNRLFYLHDGQLECNVGTFKNITATGNSTFGIWKIEHDNELGDIITSKDTPVGDVEMSGSMIQYTPSFVRSGNPVGSYMRTGAFVTEFGQGSVTGEYTGIWLGRSAHTVASGSANNWNLPNYYKIQNSNVNVTNLTAYVYSPLEGETPSVYLYKPKGGVVMETNAVIRGGFANHVLSTSNSVSMDDSTGLVIANNYNTEITVWLPTNPIAGQQVTVIQKSTGKVLIKSKESIIRTAGNAYLTSQRKSDSIGQISLFIYDGTNWNCSYMNGQMKES